MQGCYMHTGANVDDSEKSAMFWNLDASFLNVFNPEDGSECCVR